MRHWSLGTQIALENQKYDEANVTSSLVNARYIICANLFAKIIALISNTLHPKIRFANKIS